MQDAPAVHSCSAQPSSLPCASEQMQAIAVSAVTLSTRDERQQPAVHKPPAASSSGGPPACGDADELAAAECRICLSNDNIMDIVSPCDCTGSLKYVHVACLKTWAVEKRSLTCELCRKHYSEEVSKLLQHDVEQATHRISILAPALLPIIELRRQADRIQATLFSWGTGASYCILLIMLTFGCIYSFMWKTRGSSFTWQRYFWKIMLIASPALLVLRLAYDAYRFRRMRQLYKQADELELTVTMAAMELQAGPPGALRDAHEAPAAATAAAGTGGAAAAVDQQQQQQQQEEEREQRQPSEQQQRPSTQELGQHVAPTLPAAAQEQRQGHAAQQLQQQS